MAVEKFCPNTFHSEAWCVHQSCLSSWANSPHLPCSLPALCPFLQLAIRASYF